jgi:hypothetical protein
MEPIELMCDLCHIRLPRFSVAADIVLPDSTVIAAELYYCEDCFDKKDIRIVRLKRASDFSKERRRRVS